MPLPFWSTSSFKQSDCLEPSTVMDGRYAVFSTILASCPAWECVRVVYHILIGRPSFAGHPASACCCCHARQLHKRAKVFPVPVGDSSKTCSPVLSAERMLFIIIICGLRGPLWMGNLICTLLMICVRRALLSMLAYRGRDAGPNVLPTFNVDSASLILDRSHLGGES